MGYTLHLLLCTGYILFCLLKNVESKFLVFSETKCRSNDRKPINIKEKNHKMNTTNTKTVLFMPDLPNNFEIKNIILRISKNGNSKCKIQPIYIYIQGILYPRKENT